MNNRTNVGTETYGWLLGDELDMTMGVSGCQEYENRKAQLPADGRMRFSNNGKGVLFWQTDAQAACFVNQVAIGSTDTYWFSDNNVCGSSEGGGKPGVFKENACHVAANYDWQVQRVRNLTSPAGARPVWNFVEVGACCSSSGPYITNPQIRAAVWHSIIAGAQGIEYFNHSFNLGGQCNMITHHTLRDCAVVGNYVAALNAHIKSLASVLNSPSLSSGFSAVGNVRARAKWDGSNFYVFAGATPGADTATFSIPCMGSLPATATVVGEGRTLTVSPQGSWSDGFADANAVHIYRIDGGSTCGLT